MKKNRERRNEETTFQDNHFFQESEKIAHLIRISQQVFFTSISLSFSDERGISLEERNHPLTCPHGSVSTVLALLL